jgi:hypothetical protein
MAEQIGLLTESAPDHCFPTSMDVMPGLRLTLGVNGLFIATENQTPNTKISGATELVGDLRDFGYRKANRLNPSSMGWRLVCEHAAVKITD